MLGWAADYLSDPAPLVTLVVLAALGLAVHRPLARRLGWAPWPTAALLVTLAAIAAITLLPAPGAGVHGPSWSALPGCGRALVDLPEIWYGLTGGSRGERVANTLMFVPLTFFGGLATRRPVRVTAVALLVPPVIEAVQAVTDGERLCAGFDWATNAAGALIGAALALAALRLGRLRATSRG